MREIRPSGSEGGGTGTTRPSLPLSSLRPFGAPEALSRNIDKFLRAELAKVVEDARVLWLIDQILASGAGVLAEEYDVVYFPGDDLFAANRPRGLPIGNLTSQFWSNCFMNPLDNFSTKRGRSALPNWIRRSRLDQSRALWQHVSLRRYILGAHPIRPPRPS
jgi:hypothetical protein